MENDEQKVQRLGGELTSCQRMGLRNLEILRQLPLWRLRIADSPAVVSAAAQIPLTTSTGFSPRLGPGYLLYVSATGTSESIWKLANGTATELWSDQGARVFGGPTISPDGRHIAFSARQNGQTLLYVMQADGTNARVVADSLDLQGAPAWEPDSRNAEPYEVAGSFQPLYAAGLSPYSARNFEGVVPSNLRKTRAK